MLARPKLECVAPSCTCATFEPHYTDEMPDCIGADAITYWSGTESLAGSEA